MAASTNGSMEQEAGSTTTTATRGVNHINKIITRDDSSITSCRNNNNNHNNIVTTMTKSSTTKTNTITTTTTTTTTTSENITNSNNSNSNEILDDTTPTKNHNNNKNNNKNNNNFVDNMQSRGKSIADRSRIPTSFVITMISILGFHFFSKSWNSTTFYSILKSFQISFHHLQQLVQYNHDLTQSLWLWIMIDNNKNEQVQQEHVVVDVSWSEYMIAAMITLGIVWIIYVLFLAPLFYGGFWIGPRTKRHVLHRYMGLLYLIQYPLAWIELICNYETAQHSYIPHLVALNGIIQAWSAFFSFKVLPELNDAGYYADKSVLSRSFVHENAFFQLLCVFGSLYYIPNCRVSLRSTWLGRTLEYIYIFWPYIFIRPLFPITRFKDAGSTYKGRSHHNQRFYEIGTHLVKIFFLYAKYFLGFYFNFLIFLELPNHNDWKLLRGCLLLNIGTVSIGVFLHTLRFKKVFPGVMTFSIYLGQIYATIVGIPFAYHIFASHIKLMLVCFAGLLCNMTRSRPIHAAWCFVTMCLLSYPGIEW